MADQSLRVVRVQVPVIDVWLGLDFGGGKSHCLLWYKYQTVYPTILLYLMFPKSDHRFSNIQNINMCQLNVTCSCLEMCGTVNCNRLTWGLDAAAGDRHTH